MGKKERRGQGRRGRHGMALCHSMSLSFSHVSLSSVSCLYISHHPILTFSSLPLSYTIHSTKTVTYLDNLQRSHVPANWEVPSYNNLDSLYVEHLPSYHHGETFFFWEPLYAIHAHHPCVIPFLPYVACILEGKKGRKGDLVQFSTYPVSGGPPSFSNVSAPPDTMTLPYLVPSTFLPLYTW